MLCMYDIVFTCYVRTDSSGWSIRVIHSRDLFTDAGSLPSSSSSSPSLAAAEPIDVSELEDSAAEAPTAADVVVNESDPSPGPALVPLSHFAEDYPSGFKNKEALIAAAKKADVDVKVYAASYVRYVYCDQVRFDRDKKIKAKNMVHAVKKHGEAEGPFVRVKAEPR